jgi:hypothetical protein
MSITGALASAAVAGERGLSPAYRAAVAEGARNTGCTAGEERAYGLLRLLTLATLRLPDLLLYAHVLLPSDDRPDVDRSGPPVVVRALCEIAAGALRLAHRALETHGAEVGYEVGPWVDRALAQARSELVRGTPDRNGGLSVLVDLTRLAAIALTRATAATAGDWTRVAEQLGSALAYLLVVYLIATAALATTAAG